MKQIPKTLKFLAVFLVFAFCLQILPQMVLRTWAEEIADAFATEQAVVETEASETVVLEPEEIVARRTETAKHFRMPDGTVLAADYSLPIHYEKDGQWVDIDNTLSPEDGEYVTENEFTVRFAENGNSHKLLELSKDGYSIRFGISSSAKSSSGAVVNPGKSNNHTELTKLTSGVYYTEVLNHVDIEYQLVSNRIKENIIVKEPLESYNFAFDLKLHGLSAELLEDGSVALKDGEDTLWTIPAPFAYDANGNLTDDAFFTLTHKGNSGNYTLTVSLSSEWADSAAFPIVIDPYLTQLGTRGIASVTATRSDIAGDYYLSGNTDTLDLTLQPLSQIGVPQRSIISSAEVHFRVKTTPAATVVVGAREIVNGTVSTALISKATVAPGSGGLVLDITDSVRDGYTTAINPIRINQIQYTEGSCGMLLYGLYTTTAYDPRIVVRYYDSVGLEDYFSYSEFPLTSSAVYVKHATGQETVIMNCLTAVLPISMLDVTAVYNSDSLEEHSPDEFFTGLPGNNWRFTVNECVLSAGGSSYVYLDGDGTAHYFVQIEYGVYKDENGKGLTLTLDTSDYVTITDKSNNTKVFSVQGNPDIDNAYYLTDERTEAGHWVHYEYQTVNGKKQLYEISSHVPEVDSDGSLNQLQKEFVTFFYDSNGRPSQMIQSVDGVNRYRTTLRYNSAGQLYIIAKAALNGSESGTVAVTRLSYTNNKVTSIFDDAIRYDLTYENNRVATVQQFGQVNLANAAGAKVGFDYQPGVTTLRSGGADDVYGNADDIYTHYVHDQYGRTISTHITDAGGTVYSSYVYEYSSVGNNSLNPAMHKPTKTVYGGANSFYATNQSGATAENFLSDSSFESGNYWNLTSASRVTENKKMGSYGLKISGNGKASQTYTGASYNGRPKVFLVSGWAKADSMNTVDMDASFELRALVTYTAFDMHNDLVSRTETVHIPFQWLCDEWQYASGAVVVEPKNGDVIQAITSITIECVYENNVNVAFFDAITLCEGVYESVEYDNNNGNVIATSSSVGSSYSYTYDDNRVTEATRNKADGTSESATYTYGTGRFGQYLTSAELPLGMTVEYTYNSYGQVASTQISSTSENDDESSVLRTLRVYNNQGFITNSFDTRGVITESYSYSNLLLTLCSSGGISTHYEYNSNETLSRVWIGTTESEGVTVANAPVTYRYNEYNPLLLESVTTPQTTYTFVYNSFGNVTQLKAGNTALVSYAYQQGYGKLASMSYANGYSEQYSYNNLGLLSALYKNGSSAPSYTYTYDSNGNLLREDDANVGYRTYSYDTLSRLTGYSSYVWDRMDPVCILDFSIALSYDNESRLAQMQYSFANRNLIYRSVYGEGDRLESLTLVDAWEKVLQYDYLQRLSSSTLKNASGSTVSQTTYGYLSPEPGRTTAMVSSETNSAANTSLSYTYDNDGRISKVYEDGVLVLQYKYDETHGFLIREDNAYANETYLYTYDEMGNILMKKTYALTFSSSLGAPSSTLPFYYSDSNIGKLFRGHDDEFGMGYYDDLGNLSYENVNYWQYLWDGRRLVDITEDGGSPRYVFDYNADGIRTQKGEMLYYDQWLYHDYTLDGTTIVKETIYNEEYGIVSNSRDIYYYYDENGAPLGLNWNNTDYYYYKNIFGDILGILDVNGDMVVRYAYDAWGNPISTTGSKASTLGRDNPFRYRGYYYDVETGLYYLNARYYNPEWGRFISPDPFLDTTNAVGCNMFAYCGNDPINNVDHFGLYANAIENIVNSIIEHLQELIESATTVSYEVPIYNQGKTNLCWAYCQVMVEDYYAKIIRVPSGAFKRAKEIAIQRHGEDNWNKAGYPDNMKEAKCFTLLGLFLSLRKHGPLYASYGNYENGERVGGHYVVITGVNLLKREVYTNNPWGYKGTQSFGEFLDGFYKGDPDGWKFERCYYSY